MASGTPAFLASGRISEMHSLTRSRARPRSFEPSGRPPTTRTRHCAPSSCASSMARRLSSSQFLAVKNPPRQRPLTVRPWALIAFAASLTPISASLSRQGAMPRMPWRAQPSIACASVHCFLIVAVLSDSSDGSGDAMDRHQLPHPAAGTLGILQQARGIREAEEFGEVQQVARALLAADHHEVLLVAVQPGHENDAGLVEARRRAEDVARQRHGGLERFVVTRLVIFDQ